MKILSKIKEKVFGKKDYYSNFRELADKRKEVISPSGRFRLLIRYYETEPNCWKYSRGTVYRASDNTEICDIKRNYGGFMHNFVEKWYQEWLITGRSYMSQTIVNLDTGEEYEPPGDQHNAYAFCWADYRLNPDQNTLVVLGCHWAAPYEYRFYDFTDPTEGWESLECKEYIEDDNRWPEWNSDGTVTCYTTERYYIPLGKYDRDITTEDLANIADEDYDNDDNWEEDIWGKVVLKREGRKMVPVSKWTREDK